MTNTKKQLVALSLIVAFGLLPIVTMAKVPPVVPDPNRELKAEDRPRETMKKDRIKLFGEKAVLRLTTALDRADGLRQRVALHASQFPNPKFDKAIVDQKLAEASEAITKGRAAIAAIKTAMDTALAVTSATGSFADVRGQISEATAEIRAAHQKIVDVIVLIRAGYKPMTSTTTPVTN